jgi:hypothetical protein
MGSRLARQGTPFSASCPTAASRRIRSRCFFARSTHGAELVQRARDDRGVRQAHGRAARITDELTGLKLDTIIAEWVPRFRAEALGRPWRPEAGSGLLLRPEPGKAACGLPEAEPGRTWERITSPSWGHGPRRRA